MYSRKIAAAWYLAAVLTAAHPAALTSVLTAAHPAALSAAHSAALTASHAAAHAAALAADISASVASPRAYLSVTSTALRLRASVRKSHVVPFAIPVRRTIAQAARRNRWSSLLTLLRSPDAAQIIQSARSHWLQASSMVAPLGKLLSQIRASAHVFFPKVRSQFLIVIVLVMLFLSSVCGCGQSA